MLVDFISLPEMTSKSSEVLVDEILTVTDMEIKMVVLTPLQRSMECGRGGRQFFVGGGTLSWVTKEYY